MIINAENTILGRLASYAAKQALLGERVEIINCEKAVLTGTRENVFKKYKNRQSPTDVVHKPIVPKMPDMLVRRTVRGMLPWKKDRGREAYKKIICHIGIPENLKDKEMINLDSANISKLKTLKYVYVKDVSRYLGKNIEYD